MVALALIQALLNKTLAPLTTPLFDLVRSAGTLPTLVTILSVYALQFWLSYKLLMFLASRLNKSEA